MQNFVFHNPTKILFGKNTIPSIGAESTAYGTNVLLVFGTGSIKKNSIYNQVVSSLKEAGANITEHGGVSSNPVLSHVQKGINLAKTHNCQVVVAVGGGSVIDEAKAICAGTPAQHNVWKFFTGKKSIKSTLPLTVVLTLAASASEMNSGMVITNEDTKQKFGFANKQLYPKCSILDPEATYTVPANYTAYGAVDAIAHVLEFYFTTQDPSTPVQDRLMEGLIKNAMETCDLVLDDLQNYDNRANLMWTATLALNGLTSAGLGKVGFPMHMIEHSLSAFYNVPHGAGLSAVIPGWMKYHAKFQPERFRQFGNRIFGLDIDSKNTATEGIELLENWFKKVNSPTTITELNIPSKDIPKIAQNATTLGKVWRITDHDQKKIEDILQLCI